MPAHLLQSRRSAFRSAAPWAVILAAAAPSLAALAYFYGAGSPRAVQVIYFLSKALIFPCPLLWWLLVERRRPGPLPVVSRGWDLMWGAASGLLIGATIWTGFALELGSWIDAPVLRQSVRDFGSYDGFIGLALFLCLANSGLEEYYWRWFVFGRLRRFCSLPAAHLLAAAAFAAHHFIALERLLQSAGLAALLSAGIAFGGTLWSWHYQRTGRLLGVWLSHCLVDVAVLSCVYTLLFDVSGD